VIPVKPAMASPVPRRGYDASVEPHIPPRLRLINLLTVTTIFLVMAGIDWASVNSNSDHLRLLIVINAAVVIAVWVWMRIRYDRGKRWWKSNWQRMLHRRAICEHCGYDLRGNTTDACPECGYWRPDDPDAIADRLSLMTRPAASAEKSEARISTSSPKTEDSAGL
jgi:hypothetical protein